MRKVKKWLVGLLCITMILTGSVPVMAAEQVTQEQVSVQLPTYVAPKIDVVTLINYYIMNLDVEGYKKKNPDLVAVFGDNTPMYILHYVLCGIPEGRRTATWDPVAFVVNNGDAIGQSILEGKTDFFNIAKYRAAYPDLEVLYGNDGSMYLAHYLTAGILEGEISGGTFDPVTYAKSNPNSDLKTNLKPKDFAKAVKTEQSRPASVIVVSSSSGGASNSSSSSGSSSSGGTFTTSEAITKIAFRMQQNGDDQVYEVEIPIDGLAFQNEDDLYFKDLWQSLYSDYQVSLVTYVGDTAKGIYPLTYTDFDIDNLGYTATLTLDKYFFKESLKFASGVPTKLIITYEPDALPVEDGIIDNYAICMVMEGEEDNPTVKITNHPFEVIDESLTTFRAIWDDMAKMGSMYIVAFTGDKEVKRAAVNISDFVVDDEQGTASLDLLKLFGSDIKVNEKAPTSLDFKYNSKYVKLDEFRLYYELDKETGKVYDYAIDDIFDLSENGYTSFEELYNNVLKDSLFVKCYSDGILQDTKSIALSDFKVDDSTHIAAFEIDSNYLGSKYVIDANANTTITIKYMAETSKPSEGDLDKKLITDIQAYKETDGVKENISLDESYSNTGDITVSDAWSKFLAGSTASITFTYSDGTTEDIVLDISKMTVDESAHTATLNFDESLLGEDCKLTEGLDTKFVFTVNINKPEITSITAKTSDGVDISLTPTFTTSERKDSVEDYWNAYLDGKTVSIEATLSDDSTKQYPISFEKLTVNESSDTATLKLNSDFFGEDYELSDTLPTEFVFTVTCSQQEIDSLAITGNGLSGTKQTGTAGANFEVTTNNGENYSTKSDIQEVASRGYTLIGYIGDETVKHVLTVDDFTKYQAANDDRTFKITADIFGENYKFADGLSFTIHIAHKIDMDS